MLDKEEVKKNKNKAIKTLSNYLDKCIDKDDTHLKKANLISYWIKDYTNYIEQEEYFNSAYLKKYSRGDIIKVNLGFNIGNEEGGLHYCVVLDKKNAQRYSTLTVVPLTSLKEHSKIKDTSVFLGNDIYNSLLSEFQKYKLIPPDSVITKSKEKIEILNALPENTPEEIALKHSKLSYEKAYLEKNVNRIELARKYKDELNLMKKGSIALVNQITTISKQRIYIPKQEIDPLSGVKLSNEKMNLIDEKIKKLYTN